MISISDALCNIVVRRDPFGQRVEAKHLLELLRRNDIDFFLLIGSGQVAKALARRLDTRIDKDEELLDFAAGLDLGAMERLSREPKVFHLLN